MSANYKTPGVYRKEIFLRPEAPFQTAVPAFVGFAELASPPASGSPRAPVKIFRKEEFEATFLPASNSYLAYAVRGFFGNGGVCCYVVPADASAPDKGGALRSAIDALSAVDDFDLLAVPDAMTLSPPNDQTDVKNDAVVRVQRYAAAHCAEHNDRMALLDSLAGRTTATAADQRAALATGQSDIALANSALYYPWVQVFDAALEESRPDTKGLLFVPPCGHVAGIYARTDAAVGVFKSPANAEVLGVIDLEMLVDNEKQGELNPLGVNCLRAFPGRGVRVWGARTLSPDAAWRYVNVRRQFLTFNRWVAINTTWAAFEPNAARLWVRVEREVTAYLETLWQAGGLQGATRDEAFYVKCDDETNPPEACDAGEVVAEVGLALAAPAEFVVVRIFHRAAAAG